MRVIDDVATRLETVRRAHGEWTAHNIALPGGHYTLGPEFPMFDSARGDYFLDLATGCLGADPHRLTVLDLGCLEGAISVQFARAGALVDGVDIRPQNVAKAALVKDILGLDRLRFLEGDALALDSVLPLKPSYDVVICAGLLYHVDAPDLLPFLSAIRGRCCGLAIVDTHFAVHAPDKFQADGGHRFRGMFIRELERGGAHARAAALWAGFRNERSFWLSESSLADALRIAGFRVAARVGQPFFPWPWKDRGTWIAFPSSRQAARFTAPFPDEPDTRPSVHPSVLAGHNCAVAPRPTRARSAAGDIYDVPPHDALGSLTRYLEEMRARRHRFRIWWRDDDAWDDCAELRRLLDARGAGLIAVAVVPGLLKEALVRLLLETDGVSVLQHGWKHVNHAPMAGRPSELPETRPVAESRMELQRGFQLLQAKLGPRFQPVLVPPWSSCASWLRDARVELGYAAISLHAPLFPLLSNGFDAELNVEIDTAAWSGSGAFIGPLEMATRMVRAMRIRVDWNATDLPIGVVTHHALLTPWDCELLARFVRLLEQSGVVEFVSVEKLLNERPTYAHPSSAR